MVSLPHSKEKFSGFFTVKKLPLSSREEGQAAKVPAWPLTPLRSFTEPSPGSWLRSCMGPVPGQMVKTGKTAKEEANRKWKQGCRCGGEITQTLSPILPEEARLGGRWKKNGRSRYLQKEGTVEFHFTSEEEGRGGLHSLVTWTLTDVT